MGIDKRSGIHKPVGRCQNLKMEVGGRGAAGDSVAAFVAGAVFAEGGAEEGCIAIAAKGTRRGVEGAGFGQFGDADSGVCGAGKRSRFSETGREFAASRDSIRGSFVQME